MAECRPCDARDKYVAWRHAREFTFAIYHHGPARPPTDSCGMAVESGMLQPDLIRHDCRLHMKRTRLQELESAVVQCPLDLDRSASQFLAFAQEAAECHCFAGRETWLADQFIGNELGSSDTMLACIPVSFAPHFILSEETSFAQQDAIGHDLALGNRRTKAPGGGYQHLSFSGLAQPAARGACGNQRLDQHTHRGIGG